MLSQQRRLVDFDATRAGNTPLSVVAAQVKEGRVLGTGQTGRVRRRDTGFQHRCWGVGVWVGAIDKGRGSRGRGAAVGSI